MFAFKSEGFRALPDRSIGNLLCLVYREARKCPLGCQTRRLGWRMCFLAFERSHPRGQYWGESCELPLGRWLLRAGRRGRRKSPDWLLSALWTSQSGRGPALTARTQMANRWKRATGTIALCTFADQGPGLLSGALPGREVARKAAFPSKKSIVWTSETQGRKSEPTASC